MDDGMSSEQFLPGTHVDPRLTRPGRGQALVEYALILALLAIAFGFALAATGPAIGNVFSNVVYNIVGAEQSELVDLAAIGGAPVNFWQTVTWVAANPQDETPFPTPRPRPNTLEPTAFATRTFTPSFTFTFTPTPTNTPTFTPTNTPGPSPTPADRVFNVPFVEQVVSQDTFILTGPSNAANWRITDTEPAVQATWTVQWAATRGGAASASGFTLSGLMPSQPLSVPDVNRPHNFNFNWGLGRPSGVTFSNNDNWGAIFTGTFIIDRQTTLRFTASADDYVRVRRDSITNPPFIVTGGTAVSAVETFNPGTHTIIVEYGENTVNASINFTVQRLPNPDDVLGTATSLCNVGRNTHSTNNTASFPNMFGQSADGNSSITWAAGATCYLELRGYVNLASGTNPQLSFWDFWDFTGSNANNMQVALQVAEYVPDASGGLNRGALNWRTIPLRSGGTANYNWTRTVIDLAQISPALTSSRLTFRFRISNTGASNASNVRWYVDDIQVTSNLTPTRMFTVGDDWNLNTRAQMDDFIFDSDSSRTLEAAGQPAPSNSWRWDLTNTRTRGGVCCSFEESPNNGATDGRTTRNTLGNPRVHYLEFRYPIDLRSGVAPAADDEGDTGQPLLTFWHSYRVNTNNIRLAVEYSRDDMTGAPSDAATPVNWTIIPSEGLLIDYSNPPVSGTGTGSPTDRNLQTTRTQNGMQPITVRLNAIPNWDTQPFRLRFAIYVAGDPGSEPGWWIDDIALERDNQQLYIAYPFLDSAENPVFTRQNWQTNDIWAATTERGGAFFSGYSYADSPGTNFTANTTTYLEMKRTIDLLYDTPANTGPAGEGGTRPPATRPFLTFYMQRRTANNAQIRVQVWTPLTNQWVTVWFYQHGDAVGGITTTGTQTTWERIEVDLVRGLLVNLFTDNSGWTWGGTGALSVTGNTVRNDDDIRIRFVLASSTDVADGVWIDEIAIQDRTDVVHRLWGATPFSSMVTGPGDGPLSDTIDTASVNLPLNWYERFTRSSRWDAVDGSSGYVRSGALALHDSPQPTTAALTNYTRDAYHIVDYRPIIDLRGMVAAQSPVLDFFIRYQIGSNDNWRVQVSTENTSDTGMQRYHDNFGWNAWVDLPVTSDTMSPATTRGAGRLDTWLRARASLAPYAGTRIRLRWVIFANADDAVGDGLYIDDMSITWGRNVLPFPFVDNAENLGFWVAEGNWGLAPDYFFGSGSSVPDFGSFRWEGFVINCDESATYTAVDGSDNCWDTAYLRNVLDHYYGTPSLLNYATGSGYPINVSRIAPQTDLEYFLSGGRVPGTPDSRFDDTFVARWKRQVNLEAGTYQVQTISDDGVRVRINNVAGTNVNPVSRALIDNWTFHGNTLDTFVLTVTTNISRVLEVDWFEGSGGATLALYITRSSFSFTNSPNVLRPDNTYNPPVNSPNYSFNSIISNGVFDFTSVPAPVLSYRRLYGLEWGNTLEVAVSIDNGLNWTRVGSALSGWNYRLLPSNSWELVTLNLTGISMTGGGTCCGGQPNVMLRFSFYNQVVGTGATGDGVYVTDIRIQ